MPDAPAVRGAVLMRAERAHVAQVAAIERACFSDPWTEASFRQALENPSVFFRVATDGAGGLVVGYVVAWFAGGEGEIANVAVAPSARGRGIAGQLLDAAGCRGLAVGGARFSEKHANFVENMGEATTKDVVALMAEGRRRVRARFGVELEPEVQFLGDVDGRELLA